MDFFDLAARVRYVGSGEHKRLPNPLCPPQLHSDNSDCDEVDDTISQDLSRLNRVLAETIRRGQVDRRMHGDYPRYAWGWLRVRNDEVLLFEARLTLATQGLYKGYFIDLEQDIAGKKEWAYEKLASGGEWHREIA